MTLNRRSALSMLGLSGAWFPALAQQGEPLRIGAALALSGPAAVFGGPAEKALRMGVEALGSRGLAGRPVTLTVYDTEGNTTKAVQLFRRLVDNDNVHIVLGPSTSGESLAVVPVANQMEVPNISFGGAEAITKPVTPYVYCISPTDRLVVQALMTDFKERKITKLGLIYSADAFGQSGGVISKELAASYGVQVVADENFGPQDTNMTPQLLRMRNAQPQAVLVWSGNPGPSIVMRNVVEMGWSVPLYASYASGSRSFLAQTGPAAEGALVPAYRIVGPEIMPDSDILKAPLLAFAKQYKDKWNIDPDQTSGHGYDALLWMEAALKSLKGPLTRKSLRDGLETAKFNGANGPRQVAPDDHRGVDHRSVVMMQARGGRWVTPQR